jgi:hypothetical protein
MKALTFVWGFVAFTILGSDFLSKTNSFDALQDFESNFKIVDYPEDFLPNWSANAVRNSSSRVFQAMGEGVNGSQALGIQTIGNFNAEIYIKTTTKGLNSNRFSLKAKTKRNGSGNRPVSVFYSFAVDGQDFSMRQQIGDDQTFKNENSAYEAYDAVIPEVFLEKEVIVIKLEVNYGEGSGSAARLFIDDFAIEGLLKEQTSEALEILSVRAEPTNGLVIQFNQPIAIDPDGTFILNQGYGPASKAIAEEQTLSLEFDDYLYSNVYQLHFSSLSSVTTGETWKDKSHSFEIINPTPVGSILINEFMADPNPKGVVPEDPVLPQAASQEYIELLNTANKPVWLTGFSYNGGALEGVTLEPGQYVLLSHPAHKALFSTFGNTVSASPFRTLPNSSGQIVITDAFGNVVDSLSYSQAWYDHPQKQSGGWSLERVNPSLSCSDQENWKASASPQGGTPGRTNSVFDESPGTGPFQVNDILTVSSRELRVNFSKAVPAENLMAANFVLNGEKPAIQILHFRAVVLSFSSDFTPGQSYQLEIQDLNDCSGMKLSENSYSFLYDGEGPKIARVASLATDELLVYFDEPVLSSPAEEASNYQINQSLDLVRSASLTDSVAVHLVLKQPLQMNRHHTLLANDLQDLNGNSTAQLEAEFIMDDQLDTVIWAGANLLELYFHTSLDSASVINSSNFSIDRGVGSPVNSFLNSHNRQLVHLIFDQNLPVNTNFILTAKNLVDASGQYINSHKKTLRFDNRAISVAGLGVSNDSTIHLLFNKPLDRDLALVQNNYAINKGVGNPLAVELIRVDSVILTVGKLLEGQEYTLSLSGLQDVYGIKMSRTINRDFVFDLSGPEILEAFLVSPFGIHLNANEAIAIPAPDQISINGQVPAKVTALSPYELLISSPYELTENLIRLSLQSLMDLNGNSSHTINVDIPNDQVKLGAASIIKEDLILLAFTQKVDPSQMLLPDKYLVNGQTPAEATLEDNQFEVRLSLEAPLPLLDSALIEIHPLQSLDGKEGQRIAKQLWYDDQVENLFAINPQLIQVVHATALDKAATESGVYQLMDQTTHLLPIINQSDPHVLQLALSHPLAPNTTYDLVLPPRQDHSGKLIPGSTRNILYDKNPPKLVAIEALNEAEILVSFDEALDPILSLVTSFYSLNGQEPIEVIPGEQGHQVVLVFDAVLEKELAYLLTVIQLEDLHRNAIGEDSLEFYFDGPVAPAYKDLVINEIMAAPRAAQELPEAEYVELFNASDKEIALGGLILTNSRSSTVLPRTTLLPGEFVLLTAPVNQAALEKFGLTLGLSNWPALLNGGDELRLLDKNANLLDEIQYTTASYGSSEKAEGGYSLERVNPFAICPNLENLKASESPSRGTPGQVNSVFDTTPDQTAPVLQKATLRGEKEIVLMFSERLNSDLNQVKISSNPSIAVGSFVIDDANPSWLVLTLNDVLSENLPYEISIENLRDCPGNLIDPAANTAILVLPQQALEGNIVLNEILFNPKTGYPKFVEIYNQSSNYIDLQGWKLANVANDEAANVRVVAEEQLIIDPFSFLVFTTDASLLKQAYPSGKEDRFVELNSLPSYPQSRGTVLLLNPEGNYVERFDYDEKFHHSLLDEMRGISLERLSLEAEVNEPKNWHSASATSGYATPGYRNSHAQGEGLLARGITVSPQIFVPDAPGEQNFTMISYQMDEPGMMATLRIYSVTGQMIKELCQNDIWGNSGFYTWDGTDLSGTKVRPGYYILWVEVLNLEGRVENIKKTVVVGSKF